MYLIATLFFTSILFTGNSHLVHHPNYLTKLQGDINIIEPYEIQSVKKTNFDEKKVNMKQQTENMEILPITSDENNYVKQKINYESKKSHVQNESKILIDIENTIINYERIDTIGMRKQLVEIESMIIKQSKDDLNLLDALPNNDDDNTNRIDENTSNTRRLMSDTLITQEKANSVQNNTPVEFRIGKYNKGPLLPKDVNNENTKKYKESKSSSSLSDLGNKLKVGECTKKYHDMISERIGSEVLDENIKKYTPTNGPGISDFLQTRMMLFNHPRVCYACNGIHDQSCWSPNRKTSVKYCRRDHYSCLTKIYVQKGQPHIIRDCGESCSSTSSVLIGEAYASCTICESDLCNSAYGLTLPNIVSIVIVTINIIVGLYKAS